VFRQEPDADIVSKHLFRRLPVLLIEGEKEERQRRDNQKNQSNVIAQAFPGQKVGGNGHQRGQRKKEKLPLGQAEHDLAFYLGQILCDIHMGQLTHLP
jgi:hypothetical protein